MKKGLLKGFVTSLVVLFVFLGSGIFSEEAEAATGTWQTVNGSCKVRLVTDATNYYRGATTVDVYGETNGNCGTLYYKLVMDTHHYGLLSTQTFTGNFANRTPTKQFSIARMGLGSWNVNPVVAAPLMTFSKSNQFHVTGPNVMLYH